MKILKFSRYSLLNGEYEYWNVLTIGKRIKIRACRTWNFSVCGLGLTKFERDFFKTKFLQVNFPVNIYIGKLIIVLSKEIYNTCYTIESEMSITKWIVSKIKRGKTR